MYVEGTITEPVRVVYCHPHGRWEWDCPACGHCNIPSDKFCMDCGAVPPSFDFDDESR
jgi:hypothetical protein